MGCKYFIKLFNVLRGVDLNKTIKKIYLITGPKLGGGGGVSGGSAKSPNFTFFLKPSLTCLIYLCTVSVSELMVTNSQRHVVPLQGRPYEEDQVTIADNLTEYLLHHTTGYWLADY